MFRLLLSHLPGELNLIKLLNMTFLYVGSWSEKIPCLILLCLLFNIWSGCMCSLILHLNEYDGITCLPISTCCYVPVLWLRCASCSGSVLTELSE